MAEYRIAVDKEGGYHVVKIGGQGGTRATILPPDPRMVRRTFCESIEDIMKLEDFDEVRRANPRSLGGR